MDFLANIPVLGTLIFVVVPFLVVLGIVVFVHEYGHYIVGKWVGIRSEVFSIGFGPKLFGWVDRHGTRWQVAALPLGGFVKFVGDMDPASAEGRPDDDIPPEDRAAAFHNAPLAARAATVAAGPIFNFILAILLVALIAMTIGRPSDEPVLGGLSDEAAEVGFEAGDRILSIGGDEVDGLDDVLTHLTRMEGRPVPAVVERDGEVRQIEITYLSKPIIRRVFPGTPAERAGLQVGDLVTAVDGERIETYYEFLAAAVDRGAGEPITLALLRDDAEVEASLVPDMVERRHPVTGNLEVLPTLGVTGGLRGLKATVERLGPLEAIPYGVGETWFILSRTVGYLADIIAGQADASQLGGPIGIAKISGQAAEAGLHSFVRFIALLSASIGLINLFPIPILDGGHLMFYAIEALRGRPVSSAAMRVGNMIGLSLVLLLMVFATYNDLLRI